MMKKFRLGTISFLSLAVLLLVTVLAAACGGGDDEEPATPECRTEDADHGKKKPDPKPEPCKET